MVKVVAAEDTSTELFSDDSRLIRKTTFIVSVIALSLATFVVGIAFGYLAGNDNHRHYTGYGYDYNYTPPFYQDGGIDPYYPYYENYNPTNPDYPLPIEGTNGIGDGTTGDTGLDSGGMYQNRDSGKTGNN